MSASSIPSSSSAKNQRLMNVMTTPTFFDRPVTRLDALEETT